MSQQFVVVNVSIGSAASQRKRRFLHFPFACAQGPVGMTNLSDEFKTHNTSYLHPNSSPVRHRTTHRPRRVDAIVRKKLSTEPRESTNDLAVAGELNKFMSKQPPTFFKILKTRAIRKLRWHVLVTEGQGLIPLSQLRLGVPLEQLAQRSRNINLPTFLPNC